MNTNICLVAGSVARSGCGSAEVWQALKGVRPVVGRLEEQCSWLFADREMVVSDLLDSPPEALRRCGSKV